MSTQINLRMPEEFLEQTKNFAKTHGFLNVQEFFREAAREKIFGDLHVRSEYLKKLDGEEANTFLSENDSKKFHEKLKESLK